MNPTVRVPGPRKGSESAALVAHPVAAGVEPDERSDWPLPPRREGPAPSRMSLGQVLDGAGRECRRPEPRETRVGATGVRELTPSCGACWPCASWSCASWRPWGPSSRRSYVRSSNGSSLQPFSRYLPDSGPPRRAPAREVVPRVCCKTYIATYCDVSTKKILRAPWPGKFCGISGPAVVAEGTSVQVLRQESALEERRSANLPHADILMGVAGRSAPGKTRGLGHLTPRAEGC